MFDTTIVHRTEHIPTTVHHHEHRAPTDASVKLLNEFEQAAEKKLIDATRLENNFVKATYHEFRDHLNASIVMVIRITINGNVVEWREAVSQFLTKEEREKVVFDTLSKMLAVEILKGCYKPC